MHGVVHCIYDESPRQRGNFPGMCSLPDLIPTFLVTKIPVSTIFISFLRKNVRSINFIYITFGGFCIWGY